MISSASAALSLYRLVSELHFPISAVSVPVRYRLFSGCQFG